MKAKIKNFITQVILVCIFGISLFLMGSHFMPRVIKEQVEKIVQVEKPEPSIEELLKTLPTQYSIDPVLVASMIEQESGYKKDAIRFEPGQMGRAAKLTKNPEQQKMFASSHGLMQIMGWHAPKYGLSWADLYKTQTNFELGLTILKNCIDRNKEKQGYEKYYSALACYNGSETYSEIVMKRYAKVLINERSKRF